MLLLKKSKDQRGFSVIELLLVTFIIGLISAVALVSFNRHRMNSRDAKRMSDLTAVQSAVESFYDTNGYYPICTGEISAYCQNINLTSGSRFNACVCTNSEKKVLSTNYGDFSGLSNIGLVSNISPTYIGSIPKDPIDSGNYSYVYMRGYKKQSDGTVARTNFTSDFIVVGNREGVSCSVSSPCATINVLDLSGSNIWTFNTVLGN